MCPPSRVSSFERARVEPGGFRLNLINSGPEAVQVAQVAVDDAFWQYTISPSTTISRLGRAELFVPYPWIYAEPHTIQVITTTGQTFDHVLAVAAPTPTPGRNEFLAYGLLGIYVGIIPVGLGLLWFPAMKRLGRRGLGFLLALTVGLLVFLLIDTLLEAIETGGALPGVFQGVPLALFAALLTWLAIVAVSSQQRQRGASGLMISGLIALSIGLHNFGEGLAVGAAFSLGEAALGSFLVIGFILHNITEGIGIAAPLVPAKNTPEAPPPTPRLASFFGLALLAGFPAVLGTWIGGFSFSPLLGTIFLGMGMGAIWQVIVEVSGLLRRYAKRDNTPWVSPLNLAGFALGLGIMYLTAFLVK